MNLLIDALPTAVKVNDQVHEIDTDFRACLRIILAFEDNELTAIEKQIIMLKVLFRDNPPPDVQAACDVALRFLNGGAAAGEGEGGAPRLYSFAKDAPLIFAAFKQTHGIDLADVDYLHWWKFLALFMDMGSETTFCGLVSLRKRLKDGTATKEERKAAREIGEWIEVPEVDNRTLEEKEKEDLFMRLVAEGEAKRGR